MPATSSAEHAATSSRLRFQRTRAAFPIDEVEDPYQTVDDRIREVPFSGQFIPGDGGRLELPGHAVKGAAERSDFVTGGGADLELQVAATDFLAAGNQLSERSGEGAGKKKAARAMAPAAASAMPGTTQPIRTIGSKASLWSSSVIRANSRSGIHLRAPMTGTPR